MHRARGLTGQSVDEAVLVVCAGAAAAVGASWLYFGRFRLARPPIGVFTWGDLAAMLVGIVLVPYLYLALPLWPVVGLLALGIGGVLQPMLEPILPHRWLAWPATALLLGADVAAWLLAGPASAPFLALNGALMAAAVVGVANLWAQCGMRASHAAALAAALSLYDAVAVWRLGLMGELFARLGEVPFAPMLAWTVEPGRWLGLGLGDLLVAAVVPLVMRRAYGRLAGLIALALGLATILLLIALAHTSALGETFPVMVVLGPLIVAQYLGWRAIARRERTTRQYLLAERA